MLFTLKRASELPAEFAQIQMTRPHFLSVRVLECCLRICISIQFSSNADDRAISCLSSAYEVHTVYCVHIDESGRIPSDTVIGGEQ